jgi:hypothetical protein
MTEDIAIRGEDNRQRPSNCPTPTIHHAVPQSADERPVKSRTKTSFRVHPDLVTLSVAKVQTTYPPLLVDGASLCTKKISNS